MYNCVNMIYVYRQPIFTSKTYNHAVTYNHPSADDHLQFKHFIFMDSCVFQLSLTLGSHLTVPSKGSTLGP